MCWSRVHLISKLLIRRDSNGRCRVLSVQQAAGRLQDGRGRSGLMIAVTIAAKWPRGTHFVGLGGIIGVQSVWGGLTALQGSTGEHDLRQLPQMRSSSIAAKIEHRRSFYAKLRDGLRGDSSCELGTYSRLFLRYRRHKRISRTMAAA
jgi:hypothetical protein